MHLTLSPQNPKGGLVHLRQRHIPSVQPRFHVLSVAARLRPNRTALSFLCVSPEPVLARCLGFSTKWRLKRRFRVFLPGTYQARPVQTHQERRDVPRPSPT